jgi:hypothetical protein
MIEGSSEQRSWLESRIVQSALVALLLIGVAAIVTWPQFAFFKTRVADHEDPLLSMWRLAWLAHALVAQPSALFHAPIFFPEARTLAYTDAVLLPALVSAPFIWLGVPLVLVYNTLLIGSIVLSGVLAWRLADRLTGSPLASVVAALVFAYAPYRFDHYQHLELQASFGLPWALLACENLFARGRWRDAINLGLACAALVFCSIYYAVFTATLAPLYLVIRFGWRRFVDARVALLRAAIALACVGVLVVPYLGVYSRNRTTVGERTMDERYSATPMDFLHVHPTQLLLGRWLGEETHGERRLFPGVTASVLALLAIVLAPNRRTLALVAVVVGAALIALGVNGFLFPLLRDVAFPYRGLRVPARAAMVGQLAISLLAAIALSRLVPRSRIGAALLVGFVCGGVVVDALHVPLTLTHPSAEPIALSRWLALTPRKVVLELPLAEARDFYLADGNFMYAAAVAGRWNPTLNGYSGFYPRTYVRLLEVMEQFPDDASMDYLRWREVDMLVIHQGLFTPDKYGAITAALLARNDVIPTSRLGPPGDEVMVFQIPRK